MEKELLIDLQSQATSQAVATARIETMVEELHHRLLGNGNPGEIAELKARTSDLEKTKNYLKGALGILSFVLTVVGSALATHLFRIH